jgi:alkyl hydroperoxide reductase subunit AhpF
MRPTRPEGPGRQAAAYNGSMPLLSVADEQLLRQHLSTITKPVTLLLFTQTFGASETGVLARQVVDELAALSDKVTVVEKNFVLDTDDRAKYGVDKSPAIVVLSDGEDTRIRMYGAPSGYEFVPLVEAVLLAGTHELELEESTLALLAEVDKPMHLQVFSTPT